jgi:hypothetical protein
MSGLFAAADTVPWATVAPGNRRRILVSLPELMQVEFAFDQGVVAPSIRTRMCRRATSPRAASR